MNRDFSFSRPAVLCTRNSKIAFLWEPEGSWSTTTRTLKLSMPCRRLLCNMSSCGKYLQMRGLGSGLCSQTRCRAAKEAFCPRWSEHICKFSMLSYDAVETIYREYTYIDQSSVGTHHDMPRITQ